MATSSSHPSARHLPLAETDSRDGQRGYTSYSHLSRFARCPLSFQLHYVDRLPAAMGPEQHLGRVVHQALEERVREHVRIGRVAPLDAELVAAAYRNAWTGSELRDHALFDEGLALVQRWVEREGTVDPWCVLGTEQPFELHVGPVQVRGVIDRADRIGADAVRVRDYKTVRRPPSRQEVEESLQLAIYDLAARELWPWARRVEVGFDLLRHDFVLRTERSDAQREATRRYILATAAQIAGGDFPARPGAHCGRCDHRAQCTTYGEGRAGHYARLGAGPTDLPAVAREREEVAMVRAALKERQDELDDILRAELEHRDALVLEGRRYTLVPVLTREYPLEATLAVLAEAGVARESALAKLGAVDKEGLRALLGALSKGMPRPDFRALKERLDAQALVSPSSRLTVQEVGQ